MIFSEAMPDARRKHCIDCGRTREQTGGISWRGLCGLCATRRAAMNDLQIAAGVGPLAEKRLRRTIMRAHRELAAAEAARAALLPERD